MFCHFMGENRLSEINRKKEPQWCSHIKTPGSSSGLDLNFFTMIKKKHHKLVCTFLLCWTPSFTYPRNFHVKGPARKFKLQGYVHLDILLLAKTIVSMVRVPQYITIHIDIIRIMTLFIQCIDHVDRNIRCEWHFLFVRK